MADYSHCRLTAELKEGRMKLTVDNKKITPKEMMEFYMSNKLSPLIIKCHRNQDRHILFDEQPVIINALEITNSELHGINYQKRAKFTPIWLQELVIKKYL